MSHEKTKVYKAGKDSVKRALDLFSNTKSSMKRTRVQKDDEKSNKCSVYCNPIISNSNKKYIALSFLPSFAVIEMRLCLMKHDWINLQRLFPFLLQLCTDRETLAWRYALVILLHSPLSSAAYLENFLNLCVGCQNDNMSYVLDQLITLQKSNAKNKRSLRCNNVKDV